MRFLQDAQGNWSHARLIAMIVAVSSTCFMWKMTVMGEMNTTYFMYYLLYGCGAQTINKAIDAWSGKKPDTVTPAT